MKCNRKLIDSLQLTQEERSVEFMRRKSPELRMLRAVIGRAFMDWDVLMQSGKWAKYSYLHTPILTDPEIDRMMEWISLDENEPFSLAWMLSQICDKSPLPLLLKIRKKFSCDRLFREKFHEI